MTTPQHITLIDRLYAKSEKGEIAWAETAQEGMFAVSFPNYTVTIAEVQGENFDERDYQIAISDSTGKLVESFTDADVARGMPDVPRSEFYNRMRQLHEMARRIALGADKALREILEKLEEIPF